MDVDTPNLLKRSSSAPLINEASTSATSPTTNTAPSSRSALFAMLSGSQARPRRNSATCGPTTVTLINPWGSRMAPRVNQLRAEECADLSNTREVAHERQVHDAMQMGQSYEVLNIMTGLASSPTRTPARFSPSVVSPSVVSPSRKFLTMTRRSLSPIAPPTFSPVSRPNMLSKRRYDEPDSPVSKRMCTSDRLTPSTPGTPDSDSLECTFRPVSPRAQHMSEPPRNSFRPVSPRAQPMNEFPHSEDMVNHKSSNPS